MTISDPGILGSPEDSGAHTRRIPPGFSEVLRVGWLAFWRIHIILLLSLIPLAIIAGVAGFAGFAVGVGEGGLFQYVFVLLGAVAGFFICVWVMGMAHRKHYEHFRLHYLDTKPPDEGKLFTPQSGDVMCVGWLVFWRFSVMAMIVIEGIGFALPFHASSAPVLAFEGGAYIGLFFWVIRMALKKEYGHFRLVLSRTDAPGAAGASGATGSNA